MAAKKINYLDFFRTVGKSKRLLRSGWIREKIKDPESVAEHSFRVGILAMVLTDALGDGKLDKDKLIKMAILHDLGELVTGDTVVVSPRGDIIDVKKNAEKEKGEKEGIRKIFNKISQGDKYAEIFDEMIGIVTPEAKIFWQLDKLEMAIQALEYEKEQGKSLDGFFRTADLYIREPLLRKMFEEILKARVIKRKSF